MMGFVLSRREGVGMLDDKDDCLLDLAAAVEGLRAS